MSLREAARAVYVAVAGALAELAEVDGDHEAAVRLRLRVLDRDPYDEGAHLALVASLTAAGRHGDARRARRRYVERMHEIDVDPVPSRRREAPKSTLRASAGSGSPSSHVVVFRRLGSRRPRFLPATTVERIMVDAKNGSYVTRALAHLGPGHNEDEPR